VGCAPPPSALHWRAASVLPQELDADISEAWREWGAEKDGLLAALRRLDQQGALKDAVTEAFIPAVRPCTGARPQRRGGGYSGSQRACRGPSPITGSTRFDPPGRCRATRLTRQDEVQKVLRRAHWDDESEAWVLERLADGLGDVPEGPPGARTPWNGSSGGAAAAGCVAGRPGDGQPWGPRPVATPGARRPVSALARAAAAAGDMNPRFRTENILAMELDMPERVTTDWWGERIEGGPGGWVAGGLGQRVPACGGSFALRGRAEASG
jgi:hypothetical protein